MGMFATLIAETRDWCKSLARSLKNAQATRTGEAFTRAYAGNLARSLPLLYCVMIVDMAVLAMSFHGSASIYLTLGVPLVLGSVAAHRALYWLPLKTAKRSAAELSRDIDRLSSLGALIALAYTSWAMGLYTYGNLQQQSLVHYITAVTCFTGILGLNQSPRTAARMGGATIIPSTVVILVYGHPNAVAVCLVQVLVSTLLLLMASRYHADFVALEESRQVVAARAIESEHLAAHDALTGVPNRREILARLETMLADHTKPSPWLAMVDLDGFKHINDTFGHAAGDAILVAVCERISAVDSVTAFGRLGGDEFALLLPGELLSDQARAVLETLIGSISQPVIYEGQRLSVGASIGLRLTERRPVNECLERADEALYKAKSIPGRVVEFVATDEHAMHQKQAFTRLFCSANLRDQIGVVYQPIIDFDTRETLGFEALARWNPDAATCIMPATFLALAESTGRTGDLTAVVLQRALEEFAPLRADAYLSVNLSAQDLMKDRAAETILDIVERAQVLPERLTLEITETAVMSDIRRAASTLARLRKRGFRIALDDFGTGQSSLSRVHQLPLDRIKIDRSFASGLATDDAARAVAATILSLARQLGLDCTIEGIETAEQAQCARSMGLRSMQGYLFGCPVPIAGARASRAA